MEPIALHDGTIMQVHEEKDCLRVRGLTEGCCIHAPSDHPLKDAPLDWAGPLKMMFRICEHKKPHPDPDDVEFQLAILQFMKVEAVSSVHLDNCDGCCLP